MNRVEIENKLVNEIHELPVWILEQVDELIFKLKTEQLLLAGLNSGESTPLDMKALRDKAQAVLNAELH